MCAHRSAPQAAPITSSSVHIPTEPTAAPPLQGDNTNKSLAARELAVKKREEELARREAQLNRGAAGFNPLMVKNFPKCYPIVHHDISNDIPEGKRGITRACAPLTPLLYQRINPQISAVSRRAGPPDRSCARSRPRTIDSAGSEARRRLAGVSSSLCCCSSRCGTTWWR